MTIKSTFTGEMQLAGWSESHTSGCKVTFWLSSPEELEAFRALTVRKGNTAGHRFMAALVEIGDDEKPVQEPPKEPIGDACRRAVMWCKDPQFWRWIESNDFVIGQKIASEEQARQFVCQMCEVESRRELDTNPEANKAWHRLIREPYRIYLDEKPVQEPPKEPIGDACRRAVMWCKEPQFWLFLNITHPAPDHVVATENEAAEAVKALCCVDSRRELDTNPEANKAWHRSIREPYRIYLENLTKEKP